MTAKVEAIARQRRPMWLGLASGVAIIVLLLFQAGRDAAPEVQVAPVIEGDISAWIATNGKVEPTQPHSLRAALAAVVENVLVFEGQGVNQGDLLMVLGAASARADLARAREELLRAEQQRRTALAGGRADEAAQVESDLRKVDAELDHLRRDQQALQRLAERQAATRDELAQNTLALERAEAQRQMLEQKRNELSRRAGQEVQTSTLEVQRAREAMAALEQQVRGTEVRAPVAGTVYLLPVKTGATVREGDLLAEVADLSKLQVRAFVDEPDLGSLERGQLVEITWDGAPGRTWTGRTERLPKAVVPRGNRNVGELTCSIDPPSSGLLANVNVGVKIRVRARERAVTVPRAAVQGEASNRYVFVVEGKRIHQRAVALGIAGPTSYEVVQGLKPGEQVALPGSIALRDGMVVALSGK
jgi:HlyD family secretion protein